MRVEADISYRRAEPIASTAPMEPASALPLDGMDTPTDSQALESPSAPPLFVSQHGELTQTSWDIIDAENRRDLSAPAVHAALSGSPAVVQRALLAIGRIGGAEAVPLLQPHLAAADSGTRARAAFALSVAGSDTTATEVMPLARDALTPRLAQETDPVVRQALFTALGFVGDASTVPHYVAALASSTQESSGPGRTGAASGLAILSHRDGIVDATALGSELRETLHTMAKDAGVSGEAAARALAYLPGGEETAVPALLATLHQHVATGESQAAGWLAQAIGSITSSASADALAGLFRGDSVPPMVRAYAAQFLPQQTVTETTTGAIERALRDPDARVAQAALTALSSLSAVDAAPLVDTLVALVRRNGPRSAVAASALTELTAIDAARARPLVSAALAEHKSSLLRDAAIDAAATADPQALLTVCRGSNVRESIRGLNSMLVLDLPTLKATFGADVVSHILGPLCRKALARRQEYATQVVAGSLETLSEDKALHDTLLRSSVDLLPAFSRPEQIQTRAYIVDAIAEANDSTYLPTLQMLLRDPSRYLAQQAADAIKTISGRDVSSEVPPHGSLYSPTPSLAEINRAIHARVIFRTKRGAFEMAMNPDAPLAVTQFVRSSQRGEYTGSIVNRVVPNYVTQGGNPSRQDPFGHQGYLQRDEPSPAGQGIGHLGQATVGKDTGLGNFFIDAGNNARLDALYTSFATVRKGMSAVLAVQQGDAVIGVRVKR